MAALPFYAYHKIIQKPKITIPIVNQNNIGEHIRKKRIESGLLQKDVALAFNTCEDTITNWESRQGKPIISLYPKIIRFLGYYPFDHPLDTAEGLIERCRHTLGLSYERLGTLVGVHGTTLITWKQLGDIVQQDCKEKLLYLLKTTQCLS